MKIVTLILLLTLTPLPAAFSQEEPNKKNLYNVVLLMRRLEPINLTDEQSAQISTLNNQVIEEVHTIRENAGITKELILKRDEVYQELVKNGSVKADDFIPHLAERLNLTEAQAKAFADTVTAKSKYKQNVMAVLTDDQKAQLKKSKKSPADSED
ncbi:MAG: Spy/CpxP family protein refolding chaperone [Verrucomicrobiota bacterium]